MGRIWVLQELEGDVGSELPSREVGMISLIFQFRRLHLNKLPEVTQLVNGMLRTEAQEAWLWGPRL